MFHEIMQMMSGIIWGIALGTVGMVLLLFAITLRIEEEPNGDPAEETGTALERRETQ